MIFWLTGLSGAGKTTIATSAKVILEAEGYSVSIIDGDEVRQRFHAKLGFSFSDVAKNHDLIGDLCAEAMGRHDVVLVPVISPYAEVRRQVRVRFGQSVKLVYCDASLDVVVGRDVKGLYEKARRNVISDMIGVSKDHPYEIPTDPDLVLSTGTKSVDQAVREFVAFVRRNLNGRG